MLSIDFTSEPCIKCIKDMRLRTDLIFLSKKPIWKNVCGSILSDLTDTSIHSDKIKNYIETNPYGDFESRQIVKIKQNRFTGMEKSDQISICHISYFNKNVDRFYIWFENSLDGIIYKEKTFDKILFIVNNIIILEFDYEDLVYNTLLLNNNKGLGKGIYEIEWKNIVNYDPEKIIIEFVGLSLPNQNIDISIFYESYNYLEYYDNKCNVLFEY
jgi:hypothetical protein